MTLVFNFSYVNRKWREKPENGSTKIMYRIHVRSQYNRIHSFDVWTFQTDITDKQKLIKEIHSRKSHSSNIVVTGQYVINTRHMSNVHYIHWSCWVLDWWRPPVLTELLITWQIEEVLLIWGVVLSGYNTQNLTTDHSGECVWRAPCSMHVKKNIL